MPTIGFTSALASKDTAKSLETLHAGSVHPIVVTEKSNVEFMKKFLRVQDCEQAIVVSDFSRPRVAVAEFVAEINRRKIIFDNWINITDSTSAFYLMSCAELGYNFDFLFPYRNCRLKHVTRRMLNAANLCNTQFKIHRADDPDIPAHINFRLLPSRCLIQPVNSLKKLLVRRSGWNTCRSFPAPFLLMTR